jgi:hypothetical protein
MVTASNTSTLGSTGRRLWRYFLPVWLLPAVAFPLIFLPAWASHANLIFWLVMCPLLFLATHIAAIPRRRRLASLPHTVFWIVVVPLLIWAVIIFGLFGLSAVLRAA